MNIAIAQSGGPTCAINATLLGIFSEAIKHQEIKTVYGSFNGIEGIINNNLVSLNEIIKNKSDEDIISQTPATILGSCRYKLPNYQTSPSDYEVIHKNLKANNIGAFFYIGGNDSMDTVAKLSAYFKLINSNILVLGVPKTIDNDLPCTDHTPGFGSAAKYVATSLNEIAKDSSVYNLKSVTIVEIMGRDTGWLTASTCVLKALGEDAPHLTYLPECKFSVKQFLEDIKNIHKTSNSVVVAVSEGVEINDESAEDFTSGKVDIFGHKYLAGVGKSLEKIVSEQLKCKVRSIELNVMQRCSSHLCSETDINESQQIGKFALLEALKGETGKVMTFNRISDIPYNITLSSVPAENIANKVKYFPEKWINESHNGIKTEAIPYFMPLIQGKINLKTKSGIPLHFKITDSH